MRIKTPIFRAILSAATCCMALATHGQGFDLKRGDIQSFATRVEAEYGVPRADVLEVLGDAQRKDSILKAISRPAEKSKPWHEYRQIFLNQKRVTAGQAFWREHAKSLERVSAQTGVPIEIIVAIIGIETNYGRITGSYRVLDALSTLAFEYPKRSEFFTRELEHYLVLTREENVDVLTVKGSYAGAMGAGQFMPSSYRLYAVDGDANGQRDLWGSWDDVFSSIANYFLAHGWQRDQPTASMAQASRETARNLASKILTPAYRLGFLRDQGVQFKTSLKDDDIGTLIPFEQPDGDEHLVGFHNFFVITRYNRSRLYARSVMELGNEIAVGVSASD